MIVCALNSLTRGIILTRTAWSPCLTTLSLLFVEAVSQELVAQYLSLTGFCGKPARQCKLSDCYILSNILSIVHVETSSCNVKSSLSLPSVLGIKHYINRLSLQKHFLAMARYIYVSHSDHST